MMASEGIIIRHFQKAIMGIVGSFELVRRRRESSWIAEC